MTGLSAEVSAPPVAADQHAFSPSVGGLLMNIDNGGTLTDFCVIDGANVYRTKSVALWRFHPHLWFRLVSQGDIRDCVERLRHVLWGLRH
jgi:hypothetical protein